MRRVEVSLIVCLAAAIGVKLGSVETGTFLFIIGGGVGLTLMLSLLGFLAGQVATRRMEAAIEAEKFREREEERKKS